MQHKSYAQLVLAGMKVAGISEVELLSLLHIRPATLDRLLRGNAKLSNRHEDLIESHTGKSCGEFAMSILDPAGSSELSKIIQGMGKATPLSKPSKASTTTRSHRSLKLA